jgi:hypothetical protein
MIGGFIVEGQNTEVVIRAIGPDLARHNVRGVLSDPVVAIHDRTGQRIALCDDWEGCQGASELGGLTPRDRREAAMRIRLDPGEYTAIVSGKDNREGVALVEVFRMR